MQRLTRVRPIIFLDQLLFRIKDDEVFVTGTQMTFFLILSIFPFIIMLLNIVSYTPFVKPDILENIIFYLPLETQKIFQNFIKEITTSSSQGLLSISAIVGIWSSSSGIKAVIKAIDKAYDYSEGRSYIRLRIISFFFTIALILLIILVFLTLIFGEVLANKFFTFLGLSSFFKILWSYMRIVIPLVYMILMFALLYKYSPCRSKSYRIKFTNTLPGAIFTTLGWMLTSVLFSYYVNNFGRYAVTYGSLVGIILLFIWLYISSIIIVLGGEINATLESFRTYGYKLNNNKSLLINIIHKL
ncbi:YihY/virulence factor BrkB family protein [Tissierella sp.]|uniref:YihY/virulence factor BrkB family protein n=1 Tax=Tissierella sp. TaxID=41274 RepID=UPI003F97AB0C